MSYPGGVGLDSDSWTTVLPAIMFFSDTYGRLQTNKYEEEEKTNLIEECLQFPIQI